MISIVSAFKIQRSLTLGTCGVLNYVSNTAAKHLTFLFLFLFLFLCLLYIYVYINIFSFYLFSLSFSLSFSFFLFFVGGRRGEREEGGGSYTPPCLQSKQTLNKSLSQLLPKLNFSV